MLLKLIPVLVALAWPLTSANAANYIDSPPLDASLKLAVKDCNLAGGAVQVPVITWGGDIATIVSNGNSTTTQRGSIFSDKGLTLKLKREDVFKNQIQSYMKCESPYLRGTLGMIHMASTLLEKDKRTKPRVIFQHTWSQGGDALVVKSNIQSPKDLRGKTIAVQAYGPHVDYLGKLLSNAGIGLNEVTIKWVEDLTGTDNSPMAAFYDSGIDAAMTIIPDALALTSNGTVGTGAEDSVKGAKILLSTKSASRIVADVYAVREDYYKANQDAVAQFVHGLLLGQEALLKQVKNKSKDEDLYTKTFTSASEILLDTPQAIADTEGLFLDAYFVGFSGNKDFFQNKSYPRNFRNINNEITSTLSTIGLTQSTSHLDFAQWNYDELAKGITRTQSTQKNRFNSAAVAKVVEKQNRQGTLDQTSLFSFEVFFKPNQNSFNETQYENDFKKVIDLATTYGGAIITVEGHSDPLGFLKKKKNKEPNVVLQRVRQSAKNLSLTRANSVRDSIIEYAQKKNITLDTSQFAVVGHGINNPKNGICGNDPCAPSTQQEWLDNMRVEFRIIQVEAEEAVFSPI